MTNQATLCSSELLIHPIQLYRQQWMFYSRCYFLLFHNNIYFRPRPRTAQATASSHCISEETGHSNSLALPVNHPHAAEETTDKVLTNISIDDGAASPTFLYVPHDTSRYLTHRAVLLHSHEELLKRWIECWLLARDVTYILLQLHPALHFPFQFDPS